ncbi:SLC19A2_3 [Lepeophtheirus salmonis]|uniref:SLC19A2_3 n=1 Tax=Lepeophtheirus salmonis TaxID=72036 RepID=A0A7R8H285_LEPSM|nr:SLC19A2_3 [Lepeophtheirus salmonis]CAF2809314.1 SLC19A2_3 [Lepeophtheirus salmonis]
MNSVCYSPSMEPKLKLTTTLLCIYGFLKELRPLEPYLTEYLIDPRYPNITIQEVSKDVYPVWTYSYLSVLVLVFLLTDFFRYRIVIIIGGLAYVGTWILPLYAKGVVWMQVMQFAYGVASSTEVAQIFSGILGQFLVVMDLTTYRGLNYISLISVSLSTIVSFCLPKVQTSLYFHRTSSIDNEIREPRNWTITLKHFKGDVVAAFGNPGLYGGPLEWLSNNIYNGGVEAFTTFLGALFAFLLGYVKLNCDGTY